MFDRPKEFKYTYSNYNTVFCDYWEADIHKRMNCARKCGKICTERSWEENWNDPLILGCQVDDREAFINELCAKMR